MECLSNLQAKFLRILSTKKMAAAEFLGTFFLVVCGNGVMATIVLNRLGPISALLSSLGWGLALMVAVSIAGGISGGHVNPAVTVAFAMTKRCSWRDVVPFLLAQYLASYFAAEVVYFVYIDAIHQFDGGFHQIPPKMNSTAEIFATYPHHYTSIGIAFLDQVVGTALLLLVICAATDKRNLKVVKFAQPILIGLGLSVIAMAFGHNCGAPLNPARDLGPRLFTAVAGWGWKTFSFRNYTWFWVPVLAPHLGAILGALLYDLLITLPMRNYAHLSEDSGSQDHNEWEPPKLVSNPKQSTLSDVFVRSETSHDTTLGSTTSQTKLNGTFHDIDVDIDIEKSKSKSSTLSEDRLQLPDAV